MDFGKIDLQANAEKGAACHLEDPVTGELLYQDNGKPITISVLGQDSAVFRKEVAHIAERHGGKKKANLELAESNAIHLLAKLVTGWDGIIWDGEPLECTQENVRMFLTKFRPIRDQLDGFIADRSNFLTSGGKK